MQSNHIDPIPIDNSDDHGGRIRNFSHERGNWTTLVYIPIQIDIISELQNHLKEVFKDVNLEPITNAHISLTRTLVLLHHQIEIFSKLLEKAISKHKV